MKGKPGASSITVKGVELKSDKSLKQQLERVEHQRARAECASRGYKIDANVLGRGSYAKVIKGYSPYNSGLLFRVEANF